MNIICAWNDYYNNNPSYETVNIFPVLERMGHKPLLFPLVNQNLSNTMRALDYELLDVLNAIPCDLFIFLAYHGTLSPEVIKEISNKNITTLFISGDDEKYFDKTLPYALASDNVFTTFRPAIQRYYKSGVKNVIHGGYYADDKIFRKVKIKKDINVSFYGARNDLREEIRNKIVNADIPFHVFGSGWRENSAIDIKNCVLLINESKINLGISADRLNGKEIKQVKGRDFEVTMAGGFLLTDDNPQMYEFYKKNKEVAVYNGDLIDRIKYYLKHDTEREKIAEAGYARAHKEHTSMKRWKYILKNCVYRNGGFCGSA